VPSDVAAPANTCGGRGQGEAGFRAGGQGGGPVPDFANCDGLDAAKWLGKGNEADVEEAEKVGKVAADCCLDEPEHSASPDFLDIQR
jgi:hypothetical protein